MTLLILLRRVLHDVLSGKSRICLAITEPTAGSDVQGIETLAELSEDGQHFIVNGQKKVINLPRSYSMTLRPHAYFLLAVDHVWVVLKLLPHTCQRDRWCIYASSGSTHEGSHHTAHDDVWLNNSGNGLC